MTSNVDDKPTTAIDLPFQKASDNF